MKLIELKEFINNLPEEMDDFTVVNGEYGILVQDGEENLVYRVDKPVLMITVDEDDNEVLLLHQTKEDLNNENYGDSEQY
jgi:hypothetical protein